MKNIYRLILSSIFIVPLFVILQFVSGNNIILHGNVWYAQYVVMLMLFEVGIAIIFWKLNKWLSMFYLWCIFSTCFLFQDGKLHFIQINRSILEVIQMGIALLIIYAISKFDERQRKNLLRAMFGLFVIQGIWVIVQYFNQDFIFNGFGTYMKPGRIDDTVGFSASHNQIGVFFATTAPLVFIWCPYLLPLSVFGLWCSTTTMAMVSFGTTILLMSINLFKNKRDYFAVIIMVIAIAIGVFFIKFEHVSKVTMSERWRLWTNTIKYVNDEKMTLTRYQQVLFNRQMSFQKFATEEAKASKWLGYGFGKFMMYAPYNQREYLYQDCYWEGAYHFGNRCGGHIYEHAHNDYIETLFDTGYIGFFLLLFSIIDFLVKYVKARKTNILKICFFCIIAQMMCAMGVYTVRTAVTGMLLIIFYGVFLGEYKNGKYTIMA